MSTNLKRLRRKQGYTAATLAELVGVTPKAVYWWEKGLRTPYPHSGRKLEVVLGTPLEILLAPEDANGPDTRSAGTEQATSRNGDNDRAYSE